VLLIATIIPPGEGQSLPNIVMVVGCFGRLHYKDVNLELFELKMAKLRHEPNRKARQSRRPETALDALDRRILEQLQADGRISIVDLAVRVGLSPTPCLRRVRNLERSGVIARYVAVLDQRAVGLPVSVFVSIKLEKQRQESLDSFAKAISRWPEVLECYLMTGSRDYWLRVVVPDLEAYEQFMKQKLTRVEGIASIESSFALEQVKYTNVLPVV
jgi:Lrp/AsnC family leucine-responsive transcriptional regulator